jgi:hypothetical protein
MIHLDRIRKYLGERLLQEIDSVQITEENIQVLNNICNNEFYKNDLEFTSIVKKLTEQSISMNHKTINLMNILDEAECIKFKLIQKEIKLGLSVKDRPYGESDISSVKLQQSMLVYTPMTQLIQDINSFLALLDSYFDDSDILRKRSVLTHANDYIEKLWDQGEDPRFLINTRLREKVWFILEHDFENTMKKFEIDLFIEKLRLIRLEFQPDIDAIRAYYKNKQSSYKRLYILHQDKETDHSSEVRELENAIRKPLGSFIEKLLQRTQTLIKSLSFKLEDVTDSLSEYQIKELQAFIPAFSEFYQDQVCAFSGGTSYTSQETLLKKIQDGIDQNRNLESLLNAIDRLDGGMQHLYLLHWIAESLLKDVLRCFHIYCSIGKTVGKYAKQNKSTKSDESTIRKAINIRNDIAHNGLVWHPEKLLFAVDVYRDYISIIIKETNIDSKNYFLKQENREPTHVECLIKDEKFIEANFKEDIGLLEESYPDILLELQADLYNNSWQLNKSQISSYKKKIKKSKDEKLNTFSLTTFSMSYSDVTEKLIEFYKRENPEEEEENVFRQATKEFIWLSYNTTHSDANRVILSITHKLEDE